MQSFISCCYNQDSDLYYINGFYTDKKEKITRTYGSIQLHPSPVMTRTRIALAQKQSLSLN